MAYIGTDINYGNIAKQTGTGDGSDTTPIAALTYTAPSNESILVFLDGVCQVPGTDFSATGTTLTFTTAPANGVAILVIFLGRNVDIGTPGDGTVSLAKMAANSIDSDQYVDGSIDLAHIANNAIDETKLKDAFVGDFTDATVTASDYFIHGDATDSGNTKKDTVQGILDLAASFSSAYLTATYDLATASGTVDYTGAGFDPTTVVLFAGKDNSGAASWGLGKTSTDGVVYSQSEITAGDYYIGGSICRLITGAGASQAGEMSLITDGIRITWTKGGSPTGTASLFFLMMK
jgi:hypothetical protein